MLLKDGSKQRHKDSEKEENQKLLSIAEDWEWYIDVWTGSKTLLDSKNVGIDSVN